MITYEEVIEQYVISRKEFEDMMEKYIPESYQNSIFIDWTRSYEFFDNVRDIVIEFIKDIARCNGIELNDGNIDLEFNTITIPEDILIFSYELEGFHLSLGDKWTIESYDEIRQYLIEDEQEKNQEKKEKDRLCMIIKNKASIEEIGEFVKKLLS